MAKSAMNYSTVTRRNAIGMGAGLAAAGVLGASMCLGAHSSKALAAESSSSSKDEAKSSSAGKVGTRFTQASNSDEIGIVHEASSSETADVVIVGAGISGIVCAMITAEQAPDAKIVLVEARGMCGGGTNFAEQADMPDLGMSWNEALLYGEETSAASHYVKDARLMAAQKYDLGRNSSWMFTKHAVPLQIRNMEKLKGFLDAGEQIHYQPVACYDGGDGSKTVQRLVDEIESEDAYKNVEIRLETRGCALLLNDEHTVCGIQVKGSDGTYGDIEAKAVVLSCGGMSNNLELLQNYTNQDLSHCEAVDQGHYGDGMVMAEQTAHGRCKTIALSSMLGYVPGFHYQSFLGLAAGDNPSALFVNQTGARFANEDAARTTIDEKVTGVISYSKLVEGQGVVYSIMGRGLLDYYEANGLFNAMGFYGNGQDKRPFDLEAELEEYKDNENVFRADTLEKLAGLIGVPSDALAQTVSQYDADAVAGTGDSLYGKDAQYMIAMGEGPYYAFKLSSLIVNTNAGIRVNENCQVVDQSFVPVKGLYASGIAISGFLTDIYEVGNCQCVSIWSGSRAARTLVVEDLGGSVSDDWFGDSEWSNDDRPVFSNWDAYEEWASSQGK